MKKNEKPAFILSLIVLCFVLLSFLISCLKAYTSLNVDLKFIGMLVMLAGILSLIGSIFSIVSFKAKNNWKKYFAMIINFAGAISFLFMIVINLIDIFRSFLY
jgi:hypothetical protein